MCEKCNRFLLSWYEFPLLRLFRKKCTCDCDKASLHKIVPWIGPETYVPSARPLLVQIVCKKCNHVVEQYNQDVVGSIERD